MSTTLNVYSAQHAISLVAVRRSNAFSSNTRRGGTLVCTVRWLLARDHDINSPSKVQTYTFVSSSIVPELMCDFN